MANNDLLDDAGALHLFRTKLKWSHAEQVSLLERERIPDRPGIYVFSTAQGLLIPDETLYVGKADGALTSLRNRLWGYCVKNIPSQCSHRGRREIFQYRQTFAVESLYVRWTVYSDASGIEGSLIELLTPRYNTRYETVWADERDIDARYIGEPYQAS